jgi:hypothetical protein
MATVHNEKGHLVLFQNLVFLPRALRRVEIPQSTIDCVGTPVEEKMLL